MVLVQATGAKILLLPTLFSVQTLMLVWAFLLQITTQKEIACTHIQELFAQVVKVATLRAVRLNVEHAQIIQQMQLGYCSFLLQSALELFIW